MTLFHDQQIGNAHQLQFRGVYNDTGVKNVKNNMENLFPFLQSWKYILDNLATFFPHFWASTNWIFHSVFPTYLELDIWVEFGWNQTLEQVDAILAGDIALGTSINLWKWGEVLGNFL